MAKPTILTTQSVLEYPQWLVWAFQPFATNSPTSWICSPLPPGMTFDPAIGRISGAASVPGVYVIAIQAINDDGASDAQVFTIGIDAGSYTAPNDTIDLLWDLPTGEVTNAGGTPQLGSEGTLADGSKPPLPPILFLKAGDTRFINVRPVKAGVTVDIAFGTLSLALREFEPESQILSCSLVARMATGSDTFYRLAVSLAGTALLSALTDGENDNGTEIVSLAEFSATWTNDLGPDAAPEGWPGGMKTTSLNFGIGIARNLSRAN